MTNFKGTKAKWFIAPVDPESNGWIAVTSDFDSDYDKIACTIYGELRNVLGFLPEKTLANALLISKAPEMLEMLEMLSIMMAGQESWYGPRLQIRQLIKKATEL